MLTSASASWANSFSGQAPAKAISLYKVNPLQMKLHPLDRWRTPEIHTKSAPWADYEKD
jgi:hypothetical protein